jgi:hypothetical protein
VSSGNPRDCIEDIADALKQIFNKYSRGARKKAWSTIAGSRAQTEIKKLLNNPQRNTNVFRNISFRDWVEINDKLMDEHHLNTEYPPSIASLVGRKIDDLMPEELLHLAKWFGITRWRDFEHLKDKIRIKKMARQHKDVPSPEEVRQRVFSQLMQQGKRGGKWLPRRKLN